jgi:PEP-CTERM motif
MRRWLALVVIIGSATGAAWANSITIGQLQYLGTNPQRISAFKVTLDPTGVTSMQLSLFNLTLSVNGVSQSAGALTTPTTLLFVGGPDQALPSCPCAMVGLQIFLSAGSKPVTLQLANGELFTTAASTTLQLIPPGERRVLEPGDSVPITLTSVPEPSTLALIGTGLSMTACRFRRNRIQRGSSAPSHPSRASG